MSLTICALQAVDGEGIKVKGGVSGSARLRKDGRVFQTLGESLQIVECQEGFSRMEETSNLERRKSAEDHKFGAGITICQSAKVLLIDHALRRTPDFANPWRNFEDNCAGQRERH